MTHGLDTGFLVAFEHAEHSQHADARKKLAQLLGAGDSIAVAPQVLAEFVHVITDGKRFPNPHSVVNACQIAERWWTANETVQVFPDGAAVKLFLDWVRAFSLGRKRLLDTLLAATLRQASISSILTTNPADFAVLGGFTCISP